MIYGSKEMAHDDKNNRYVAPVWQLDTDSFTVIHTDPKTLETESYTFTSDYIREFISYNMGKDPRVIERLVESGRIYSYLDELDERCITQVDKQARMWAEKDKGYIAARKRGDILTQSRIFDGLELNAKHELMRVLIYR